MASTDPQRIQQIKAFVIVAHSNLEQVQTLLAADPSLLEEAYLWTETDPETALMAASHMGNRPIAEYLLGHGALITAGAAAMLGRRDDLAAMLAANPVLANASCVHGIRLLFHVALSGDVSLAELLMTYGCNGDFNHALHGAAAANHLAMAIWLLDHGVTNMNTPDFQGKTPLKQANEHGFTDLASLLTKRGASE